MVVVSRRFLRQTLGTRHIRDTFVSNTTLSHATQTFSLTFIDYNAANLAFSGRGLYEGAWLRIFGGDLRVGSFNTGSGAYLSSEYGAFVGAPSLGMPYERHEALPPADKDRALDDAIKRLRVRREVALWSVDGLTSYTLPVGVEQVLGGYYFANPAGSLDRGRAELRSIRPAVTATGAEVRIDPALGASQQLVLDAITTLSLGSSDDATVNIPDERLVLYAAEAACWDLMVRKAPRGTSAEYRSLRDEAARQYNQLARNFKVPVDRAVRLDEDF